MQPDAAEPAELEFAARLEACEVLLNAGDEAGSSILPQLAESDAQRQRLERGLACVKRLKKQWPGRTGDSGGRAASGPHWGEMPAAIGRFQIRRELGRGAYGVVFLAHDPVLGRDVALKLPRVDVLLEPDLRDRFAREARAAAALDHPHIVQVYEAGQIGPVCYIASAYCPGETLAEWLRRQRDPVSAAEAATLVATLAAAVDHAHGKGILHRDIKPGNVLLQDSGGAVPAARLDGCTPKITDFGLAKMQSSDLARTHTGSVLGTPSYMAPEQARGKTKQITATADVYALGAVLYELLTGRPPFQGDSAWDTLQQVQTQEPVPPAKLRWKTPRDLETICLKCLEKEPARRYATARDLADDLQRYVSGRTIHARPATRREQAVKWARRKPVVAGLLAGLVLVTALGFAGVTWQWLRADRALADLTEAYNENATAVVQRERALSEKEAALTEKEQQRAAAESHLYSHLVASAHLDFQSSNLQGATELLAHCPPAHRHWEWNYVQRLCHAELLTFAGHQHGVVATALSPDGRRLATSAGVWGSERPAEIVLWDAETGARQWTLPTPVPYYVLNFDGDAARLWTASSRGVQCWDVTTQQELQLLREPAGPTSSLCLSPDGRTLAAGGGNGHLTLWDLATGEKRFDLAGHHQFITCVGISRDSSLVATASRDGTARIWERDTGRLRHILRGSTDIRGVAFRLDGKLLATVSYDKSAKIWDVETGAQRLLYTKHEAPLLHVAFTPDGRLVATADGHGDVRFWDPLDGRDRCTLHAHSGGVSSVQFLPAGRLFVTAGADRAAKLWDIDDAQQARVLTPGFASRSSLALTADGRYLAYAEADAVGVLDLADNRPPAPLLRGHRGAVLAVALSSDDSRLASAGQDGTIRVWRMPAAAGTEPERTKPAPAPDAAATAGRLVRELRGWAGVLAPQLAPRAESERFLRELRGHDGPVTTVAFEPQSQRLFSGGRDTTVRVWDAEQGALLQTLPGHAAGVLQVAVARGSPLAASTDLAGTLILWDRERGKEVLRAPGGGPDGALGLAFSPDGRWLGAADSGNAVRVWDVERLKTAAAAGRPNFDSALVATLAGHTGAVTKLAFSPDGRRLASSSYDFTIRLWDLPSGTPLLRLNDGYHVADACFTPDGAALLSLAGGVHRWNAGRPTTAANAARRAAVAHELPAWHRRLADACYDAQQWASAVFHFDHLSAAGEEHARLFRRRGYAHAALGNFPAAAADLRRACELDPRDLGAACDAALVALQTGDGAEYERYCRRAVTLVSPGATADSLNTAAWMCALRPAEGADAEASSRIASALALAERAAAAAPGTHAYLNTLGAALYRAGRWPEALETLTRSVAAAQGEPAPEDCLFLALTHRRLKQPAESAQWLDRWAAKQISLAAANHLAWPDRLVYERLAREAE